MTDSEFGRKLSICLPLIACTFLFAFYSLNCSHSNDSDANVAQSRAAVDSLIARHGPATGLFSDLKSRRRGLWSQLYTIDIQRKFDTLGSRKVFVVQELSDIWQSDSGYTVSFITPPILAADYYWFPQMELSCSESQVESLLNQLSGDAYPNFAVVAQIKQVIHPRFHVSMSIDDEKPEYSSIIIDEADIILLRGRLIDAMAVDDIDAIPAGYL